MENHTVSNGILNIYRRIGILTSSSVFLLFLLGGLVRATGSGMGCPDWPKCFGQLAPPLDAKDLPENYEEIFLKKRLKKLDRFTQTLESFGMNEKAERIRKDPKMYEPEEFHPVKAWIEYINRLFGVLSGLLAVAMGAFIFWKPSSLKPARWWYLLGFIFLILNAWLGSVVVTTNLLPGIVSLHFLLAFICLFGFVRSVDVLSPIIPRFSVQNTDFRWFWLLVWFVVIIGTWSREQVDVLKGASLLSDYTGKLNISAMDVWFAIHRYVPFLMLVFLVFRARDKRFVPLVVKHYRILGILVLLQILLGAVHIWFVVPAWTQILHVLAGSALLTYSFLLFLSSKRV